MPAIQILKKKLKGIRSTQKLSKAMKTASAAKFSKLNAANAAFSGYGTQIDAMYKEYDNELMSYFGEENPDAPLCVVIFASNRTMCGSFNSEVFAFAEQVLSELDRDCVLFLCGKQTVSYFDKSRYNIGKTYIFNDIPNYNDGEILFNDINELYRSGRISSVKVIYPHYINTMNQVPEVLDLFKKIEREEEHAEDSVLWIPDKASVLEKMSVKIFKSIFYKVILETATGAQAATLLTMRSAYDTASDYSVQLESEINRQRQSVVTADVIETSSDFADKGV